MTCCRVNSGLGKDDSDRAGFWGSPGKCDVPARTVESALNFVGTNVNPDMVLWLGDNVYGSAYNVTQESETEVLIETTGMVKRALSFSGRKIPVFPVLGNHEGFPVDTFNVNKLQKEQWLLNLTGELWNEWLDEAALAQYKKTGYYTQLIEGTSLRIVALNSLLYINDNMHTMVNSTDPLGQVEWLERTLAASERNHESVFVIEHVPICCERGAEGTNSEFELLETSGRMMTLLERYANTVRGVFAGHYHSDFVRVLKRFVDSTPYALEFVAPSISTYDWLTSLQVWRRIPIVPHV